METFINNDKQTFATSYNNINEVPPELDPNIKETAKNMIRQKRNKLLAETDIYLISDYPITPDNLIKIKEYRQLLRDFMQQENIFNLELPKKPDFIFKY